MYALSVALSLILALGFYPANSQFTKEHKADRNTVLLIHMNETTDSTNVLDASSFNNNGSVLGTIPLVPGKFGKARRYSGDVYVNFGNPASLQLTDKFTIEAFIKIDTFPIGDGPGYIVGKYDGSDNDVTNSFQFAIENTGVLYFKVGRNEYTLHGKSIIPLGQWTHVAATYDGTLPSANMKVYINGIIDASLNRTGTAPTNSAPVLIGQRNEDEIHCPGCYHKGTIIDEVRISNIVRTFKKYKLKKK